MKHTYNLPLNFSDPLICSNALLDQLGHGPTFKLMADHPNDAVHGSLSILHTPGDHLIIIDLYDQDEAPTDRRTVRLVKHQNQPTKAELLDRLTTPKQSQPNPIAPGLLAQAWDKVSSLFG